MTGRCQVLVLRYKKLTAVYALFSLIYLLQTSLTKPSKDVLEKYHISSAQVVALSLTITIPYLVIWFIGLVGYLRFKSYTDRIAPTKDGRAFKTMGQGILLLTLWLPLSAVLGAAVTQYYTVHHDATALMVNINNYFNIIILLPAFILLAQGSARLLPLVRRRNIGIPTKWGLISVVFAAVYTFLVFHDPARQFPTHNVKAAGYYLPDWAILLTIVVPRLIMWFLGAQAVYNLSVYYSNIKGTLYRSALEDLAKGIGVVVLTAIILRCLQSLSVTLGRLSIALLLLIIYALLAVIAAGYILIAQGAKRLQLIEEA